MTDTVSELLDPEKITGMVVLHADKYAAHPSSMKYSDLQDPRDFH